MVGRRIRVQKPETFTRELRAAPKSVQSAVKKALLGVKEAEEELVDLNDCARSAAAPA